MFSLKRMWELRAQIVVNAPPDEVFSYVTDFDRHHEWLPEDRETEKISEGPVGVGSTFRRFNRRMIRPYQSEVVVTEYAPNERLGFEDAGENHGWRNSVRLEPDPASGGTRVTVGREPVRPLVPPWPWWYWLLSIPFLPWWQLWFRPFYQRRMRAIGSRVKEYHRRTAA